MVLVIVSLALALFTGAITAWRAEHAAPIDRQRLAHLIDVPAPWTGEVASWLHTPEESRFASVQVVLRLTLLVTSIVTFGWLWGLGLVVASFLAGATIGSRRGEPVLQIGPELQRAASLVRTHAQALRAGGDVDRARAADQFATRIDFFREVYGQISPTTFNEYQTPQYVAALLESYYLPEALVAARSWMPSDLRRETPPRSGDDSDIDFPPWLEHEIHPLSPHPYEQNRAARLERVRREILAGGGTGYRNLERIQQIVADLRRAA